MVKPWHCPHCRSRSGVPVQYGLPTPAMADAAARGEVVLGGCVLGDDDPRRCCLECRAALWAGGVFAVPGAADDRRIVLHSGLGRRRLEASIADDYSLTISWRDSSGPAETSVTIPGDDIDLLILVLSVHLFADGAGFARFLRQRGIGFVGEVTAVIDRFHFTSDGMLAFTGPQGDLLVHSSVERLILHLVRSGFRRQGYRSIVEFREWLSGIGLDIVRSEI